MDTVENVETAKKIIEVSVRDRVATHIGDDFYVCGNTEYEIHFDFDEEWDALDIKTARFIADGNVLYPDRIFSGNVCSFPDNPPISNTTSVRVGVFAGNLHTTTPARIPAAKSILCGTPTPAAPEEDAYHEAMEEMAKVATEARTQAEASAQSAQASAKSAQSAAEVTVVASECAQAAEAAKTSAEQYSANADAQARAAAQSANAAAASASESVAARDKAIAQADDAEESAKVASNAAQAARDSSAGVAAAEAAAAKSAQSAAEVTVVASECARAAEAAKTSAEQYSANADAQARAAAQSANAAAASASESVAARDKAIARADDAEESAKAASNAAQSAAEGAVAASECAKAAEAAETSAEQYSANADAQARAAEQSAQSAAESVQDLFIVKVVGVKPSHNQSEIKAAVAANKTCLLVDSDGRVFSYFSEHYDQGYGYCPAFHAPLTYKFGTGILYAEKYVTPDGHIIEAIYSPARTPNPYKLKLTGAVDAEYDGSSAVAVEIPAGGGAGLPETADPLKQLVTDENGKVAWEDRLAYKQTVQAVNLEATEMMAIDEDGDGANDSFALVTPWAADVVAGAACTVTYNGTDYECKAIAMSDVEPSATDPMLVLGNLDAMGMTGIEGSNPDAPFVLITMPNELGADFGAYGQLLPLDGATTVTIAVSSVADVYTTIDPGYLPKQEALTFTGRTDATYDGSMPMSIEIPTALPNPQRLTFSGAVAATYNGQSAVTVKLPTTLPNPKALTFTGATSATYNGNSALTVDIPKVPKPTTSDAGKFLRVNTSGEYALEAIANAEEATF